jgi:hypothetical protein
VIGSTNEVAFSDTLKVLKGDNRGLDTEGITPDGKGGYWLCDEYGSFLINVDSKGKILAVHGPQAAEGKICRGWFAQYYQMASTEPGL